MPDALRQVVQHESGCEVIGVAIPARGQFLRETRIAGYGKDGKRRELPLMAKDRFLATAQEAIDVAIKEGRAYLEGKTLNWDW